MKAARIHAYGGPDEFRIDDVPRPKPGPRDVLIEVHASSVNPVDCKMRGGGMRGILRYRLPLTMGFDVSGVVVEAGDKVTRLEPGDAVYSSPHQRQIGTYAEYVVVDERHVGLKPSAISHAEAAGIPLAGLTAWQCLDGLQPGQRALILAGAGGVGTLAIQLAKERGAHVATTCSARNVDLVRELGADEVIDYTRQEFQDVLSGYDLALDALGGPALGHCRRVLRRGGRLSSIVSDLPTATKRFGPYLGPLSVGLRLASFKFTSLLAGVSVRNVLRTPSAADLDQLTRRIEAGTLKPLVDRVFPLEEIAEAHRASEAGRARGKIVISVRGEG
jgi:NADPH:quinone reductase-like Zn-dependent oxidoreductase